MNSYLQNIRNELMEELVKATPDDFIELRLIILADAAKNKKVYDLMAAVFQDVEKKRPLLIEMK